MFLALIHNDNIEKTVKERKFSRKILGFVQNSNGYDTKSWTLREISEFQKLSLWIRKRRIVFFCNIFRMSNKIVSLIMSWKYKVTPRANAVTENLPGAPGTRALRRSVFLAWVREIDLPEKNVKESSRCWVARTTSSQQKWRNTRNSKMTFAKLNVF